MSVGTRDRTRGACVSYEAFAGDPVVNRRGEALGAIADVVIDVRSGRVAYAVVARGGVLGLGEKLHAVPWSSLARDEERACFVLDMDAAAIDAMPVLDAQR